MENILFELEHIRVDYLEKEVLNIDRLTVHQFDRIGIIGKNGAGKSTLIKLLAGQIQPNRGKVKRYVQPAYFKQLEQPVWKEDADGALLSKLGISDIPVESSGGEQTRLKLARLFTEYHEALLIDEPTTHIDQKGIEFLMEQLRNYYGALVLVSHDRNVLDQVVDTIWEISDGRVHVYKGNYSEYEERKQREIERQKHVHEHYVKEKIRLEKAAKEKMQKAQKMLQSGNNAKQKAKEKPSRLGKTKSKATSQKSMHRAAKSIEGRIEKLTKIDAVTTDSFIKFPIGKALQLHNKIPIMADHLRLQNGGELLLNDVNFQIPLGKKIAITGANGCGKSTLLKHIANHGEGLVISPKAKIGFFKQMSYRFSTEETLLSYMKKHSQKEEGFLRSVLSKMLFTEVDLKKSVKFLSGGEAVRLKLCELFLGEYNILLLDEPTNFLDIPSLKALEQFINGFAGTVIFVTHDERFMKRTADLQYEILTEDHTMIQIK